MRASHRRAVIRRLWKPANAQSIKLFREWTFGDPSKVTSSAGAVSSLAASAGNGALAQGTGGAQPTYNPPYSATFDGSSDYLDITGFSLPQPSVHVVVTKLASVTGAAQGRNITDSYLPDIVNSNRQAFYDYDGGFISLYAGGAGAASTRTWDVGTWSVAIALFNGSSSKVWYNGVLTDLTGDAGSSSLEGLTLATYHAGDGHWHGEIASISLFMGIPSDDDIARLSGYYAHSVKAGNILPVGHRYRNVPPVC